MDYQLHCAQAWIFYYTIPFFLMILLIRLFWHKIPYYRYSLAGTLQKSGFSFPPTYRKVFFALRIVVLVLLLFLLAKPQIVDTRSRIRVEGIDMVLVLDVSGSMQYQDYSDDNRSRLDVAKDEAIHFIQKRVDDAIGLVIFAKDAVSRVPLTLDKKLLQQVVHDTVIGVIDHDGTMLSTALMSAINRLKHAKASSKIIIILTDGTPSEGDLSPDIAIDAAKKLGIKIYTIGIGSEENDMLMHPLYGLIQKPKVNKELLVRIAQATNGKFFMAQNAADMRAVYDTIDSLEKTVYETSAYNKYYDIFIPIVLFVMGIMMAELFFSTFIWFGI